MATVLARPAWLRRGPRPVRVRFLSGLAAVATMRGTLGVLAPASEQAPTPVFLVTALIAATLGCALWFVDSRWLEPVTLGTGLACVTVAVSVAASGTGAVAVSVGYVWLNLYVAFFGSRRATRLYALTSVVTLAVALALNPFPGALAAGLPLAATVVLVSEATNRLVRALDRQATTDHLTGLLNRVGLERSADPLLAQSERRASALTVVVLDLDGFKAVNDRQGHAAGDAVLRTIALSWERLLRRSDVAARIGGDEFVLVLPDTDASAAEELVRRLLQHSPIAWSHGLAAARAGVTLTDLIDEADHALYRVKADGRRIPLPRPTAAGELSATASRPAS